MSDPAEQPDSDPVAIGSDHAGFEAKERLMAWLEAEGYAVEDYGVGSPESADYPDVAHRLAARVASGDRRRGILICGTGLGMSYSANRHPGVRAAVSWSTEAARLAREHNDANVLVLPGRIPTMDPLEAILRAWLGTSFTGADRHARRIRKIDEPGGEEPHRA
jgi:ribose 5-phosphate isomerase B